MYKIETPAKGLVSHGMNSCAGCAMELALRRILDELGKDVILVTPPGCAALFNGMDSYTNLLIPGFQCHLENTATSCEGVRAALDALGNTHTTVLGFAGDGGTVDIGLQALSGMIERNARILYICYDNEAYMNTGTQGSGATPRGASSTTSPLGKLTPKKDLLKIAIAHGIHYAASASVAYIRDLSKKVKKAQNTQGASLIHLHTPCPTGWAYDPAKTIELAKKAVDSGMWMLYEYENEEITITHKPSKLIPVENYLCMQGRFSKLDKNAVYDIQKEVDKRYNALIASAKNLQGVHT